MSTTNVSLNYRKDIDSPNKINILQFGIYFQYLLYFGHIAEYNINFFTLHYSINFFQYISLLIYYLTRNIIDNFHRRIF